MIIIILPVPTPEEQFKDEIEASKWRDDIQKAILENCIFTRFELESDS